MNTFECQIFVFKAREVEYKISLIVLGGGGGVDLHLIQPPELICINKGMERLLEILPKVHTHFV